jgi:hypothetical protein
MDKSAFTAPANPNVHIWRYMDFTKFVSMLQNEGLFFCRADKLEDSYEGFYPKGTEEVKQSIRHNIGEALDALGAMQHRAIIDRKRIELCRQYVMVNCWQMSDHESPAMWKVYAKSNEAVAIRSSYSTLRKCVDTSVHISVINYLDDTAFLSEYSSVPDERIFIPFVNKRKYFGYEQELRAVFSELSKEERGKIVKEDHPQIATAPRTEGLWQQVQLNELIEEVFIAPTAPTWFRDLVNNVSKKYGLKKPARQSSLDQIP